MNRKVHQQPPNPTRRCFLQHSALAMLGLAGGGLPGISWAVHGDTLHIRNYQDISSLDPVSSLSDADGIVFTTINQNLLRFLPDGTWNTRHDAAEFFEQRDAIHYDFRLKSGQMFTNDFGEMTAEF